MEQFKKPSVTVSNMSTYTHGRMMDDMHAFEEGGTIRTGYQNIDMITNLYPGLYVLGAISSLGKTTFAHQMADQLAEDGQQVIFFSMEQSTLELASKSLSRITAWRDLDKGMTSLQIRKHGEDPRVQEAVRQYDGFSGNVNIVECGYTATIEDIENLVALFIKEKEQKPVVIIDYLQVIQPAENSRLSMREQVDQHMRRLKQLQSQDNLVVIVISSLNRLNYTTQIDFESFKETSGIEYTADVIWGLQLQVLNDPVFNGQGDVNRKRLKVREAKAAIPREVELVCLKNRFGISSYTCRFRYYPQRDLFVPDMDHVDLAAIESHTEHDPDGFMEIPYGVEPPFI